MRFIAKVAICMLNLFWIIAFDSQIIIKARKIQNETIFNNTISIIDCLSTLFFEKMSFMMWL